MTDKEKLLKLRKLADAMYYAAKHLTTDASRLHEAMDEYHQFIIYEYHKEEPTIPDIVDEHFYEMLGEEPVSEELEEAAHKYADIRMSNYETAFYAFMFGAKWQKEQIKKSLLSEVLPIFMHGGEADEVVAKLDEVLSQKK